jgi:CheY-like chemotaxis protein
LKPPIDATEHALLLVEDNEDDEALSLRAVKKSGVPCEVVVLRTGAAAMGSMVVPNSPIPELIILDFHLPHYTGIEILRELRKHKRFRDVPIVMFSSLQDDSEFAQCLREGANSIVQKPDEPSVYVEKVALMVRYWLTVHRNITRPTSGGDASPGSEARVPQVHIIKQALSRAYDQKFTSHKGADQE